MLQTFTEDPSQVVTNLHALILNETKTSVFTLWNTCLNNLYAVLPPRRHRGFLLGARKPLRMVDLKIITNSEYKQMIKDEFMINYGFHQSPFGKCLIGLHGDRICHLSFVKSDSLNVDVLKSQWPQCTLVEENIQTGEVMNRIFNTGESFGVLLKGTEFEGRVWQALLTIPRGKTVSYEEIAKMAGRGKAVRAAANAVAKNFVSYLVPCHRVIRKNGDLHKYQGGAEIKRKILEFEDCAI